MIKFKQGKVGDGSTCCSCGECGDGSGHDDDDGTHINMCDVTCMLEFDKGGGGVLMVQAV